MVLKMSWSRSPPNAHIAINQSLASRSSPPPFRRGLAYANQAYLHPLKTSSSAMSSSSSIASGQSNGEPFRPAIASRRRTTSVSANDPIVISTDRVRPDWHQKLAVARAHTAQTICSSDCTTHCCLSDGQSRPRGRWSFIRHIWEERHLEANQRGQTALQEGLARRNSTCWR